jgi:cytochrome b561
MNDPTDRYGLPAQLFHWLVAGLILFQVPLAYYMIDLPLSPAKLESYALHKSIGLTIFSIAALRLAWRWLHRPPALPSVMPGWQAGLARLAQWLLYALIFVMPLTGWMSSSAANFPVSLFGWFTLPDLVEPDRALHERLELAHRYQAYLLFTLVATHAGAALHHHFVRRDGVLASMIPGLRPRG